jgi:hypothetical protein
VNNSQSMSPVVLTIRGLGHVPSFKNSKMVARGRLITDPKKQRWMEAATLSMLSQLRSESVTRGTAILTGERALYSTASFTPLDDCSKWIVKLCVSTQCVSKGEEGAEIIITRTK